MGIQVVAGWDHDADRLAKAVEAHGVVAMDSAEALLARADVQAVVIASETSRHADLVELAAAAGKAIVLQKPMALELEEADRIVAAVERAGVPFTMAWQMRVDPHNLLMKELLASGTLGRVQMVRRRHCLSTHKWDNFAATWHNQPELNRDIFADDASHPADFILWLLGMPASVTAEMGTLINPRVPNDNGIAIFRYPDGVFAEVSCSFAAVAGESTTEIICEHGSIIHNYGDGISSGVPAPARGVQLKWFLDGQWTVSDLPEITSHSERIAGLAGPLAAVLHGARPPIATAEEGRNALRMILACYTSAGEGRRVSL
jgi:predicted dehydrogenase